MQGRTPAAAILAACVLALPAVASAQAFVSRLVNETTLLLAPGERVTLQFGSGGRLTLVSAEPADEGRFLPPPNVPAAPPGARNPMLHAPAGAVAFTFAMVGEDALMKVENATAKGFDYQAMLMDAPRPPAMGQSTSVCTVRPNLVGYELWPGRPVAAILLSGFSARQTDDAVCSDPAKARPGSPQTD